MYKDGFDKLMGNRLKNAQPITGVKGKKLTREQLYEQINMAKTTNEWLQSLMQDKEIQVSGMKKANQILLEELERLTNHEGSALLEGGQ
jgi:hypothetical protein